MYPILTVISSEVERLGTAMAGGHAKNAQPSLQTPTALARQSRVLFPISVAQDVSSRRDNAHVMAATYNTKSISRPLGFYHPFRFHSSSVPYTRSIMFNPRFLPPDPFHRLFPASYPMFPHNYTSTATIHDYSSSAHHHPRLHRTQHSHPPRPYFPIPSHSDIDVAIAHTPHPYHRITHPNTDTDTDTDTDTSTTTEFNTPRHHHDHIPHSPYPPPPRHYHDNTPPTQTHTPHSSFRTTTVALPRRVAQYLDHARTPCDALVVSEMLTRVAVHMRVLGLDGGGGGHGDEDVQRNRYNTLQHCNRNHVRNRNRNRSRNGNRDGNHRSLHHSLHRNRNHTRTNNNTNTNTTAQTLHILVAGNLHLHDIAAQMLSRHPSGGTEDMQMQMRMRVWVRGAGGVWSEVGGGVRVGDVCGGREVEIQIEIVVGFGGGGGGSGRGRGGGREGEGGRGGVVARECEESARAWEYRG
ncbi:predicted protein [Plenodomus lingam JN3]|uniref:Predicted protein n=1 Tax=Leptosphaeria maculans (strain JN3 / isolate v23.1.3 / race Av1-4-5-6-7-8) TaxID=985895 RepID=E5ABZ0_LEPMJ|nr:predicted protein [Plenodomus lingam JN3]CBY01181.1 predicted protein [Plenodomus lingam JN3]